MPAQFGEDIWIEQNVKLPERGFYIDVGCAFPDACSNTQFLRNRGWAGLAIDANPAYSQFWPGHFMVAIVSDQPIVCMDFRRQATHSRIAGKGCHFAAVTLENLCQALEIRKVDVLSLDIEGGEFAALRSLDLKSHNPTVIISEFITEGIPGEDWRVRDFLLENGYRLGHRTEANVIMVRDETR